MNPLPYNPDYRARPPPFNPDGQAPPPPLNPNNPIRHGMSDNNTYTLMIQEENRHPPKLHQASVSCMGLTGLSIVGCLIFA
jgi:hypothetical protein